MRALVGIVSVVGIVAYGKALILMLRYAPLELPLFRSWAIGVAVGFLTWIILRKALSFFTVFEHELTHLIFSLMMFQRPHSFYASNHRGHVACDRGNFIDGLAPYFFPTFAYLLLALYPLLKPKSHPYFYPILGFMTGYHLISNIGEFSPREADIRRYGVVFSLVFSVFAGIVTFGFIVAFVANGFAGGLEFLRAGLGNVREIVSFTITNVLSHRR